jgi:hypothetical protein
MRAFPCLEVLTRYIVFRQGRRALRVHSEHLDDPQVAKFFAELAKAAELTLALAAARGHRAGSVHRTRAIPATAPARPA